MSSKNDLRHPLTEAMSLLFNHNCVAPGEADKRKKSLLCSNNAHPCERDTAPPAFQGRIRVFAAQGKKEDLLQALNFWEGKAISLLCVA